MNNFCTRWEYSLKHFNKLLFNIKDSFMSQTETTSKFHIPHTNLSQDSSVSLRKITFLEFHLYCQNQQLGDTQKIIPSNAYKTSGVQYQEDETHRPHHFLAFVIGTATYWPRKPFNSSDISAKSPLGLWSFWESLYMSKLCKHFLSEFLRL